MTVPLHGRGGGIVAAAILLLAGCHHNPYGPSYYNYGPYAPTPSYGPSYGPTLPPGGGYITPSPTYIPQNSSPTPLPGNPNSPTPISPGNTGVPNFRPDPNLPLQDAPPFRTNPGSNNNNLVPDPLEPDFSAPPAAAMTPRAVPFAQAQPIPSTPVSSTTTAADPFGDDPFEKPRQVTRLPTDVDSDPFGDVPISTGTNKPATYSYDTDGYTWLRGIVDYDEASQSWSIIYNLTPAVGDKFGGSFVLGAHPSLKSLKSGSFVLVKGQADPGRTDGRGKPLYEIQQLIVLTPPSGIQ